MISYTDFYFDSLCHKHLDQQSTFLLDCGKPLFRRPEAYRQLMKSSPRVNFFVNAKATVVKRSDKRAKSNRLKSTKCPEIHSGKFTRARRCPFKDARISNKNWSRTYRQTFKWHSSWNSTAVHYCQTKTKQGYQSEG
jgi:hypothetical protein